MSQKCIATSELHCQVKYRFPFFFYMSKSVGFKDLPSPMHGGTKERITHVHCTDCGRDIPVDEWPNHRDRLRSLKLKERTLSFVQRYVVGPFLDMFMWVLVNVFFREVAVVGSENIPASGPVVFYGNHQNQFMDACVMRATCGRRVRFIIAEKSMHRAVIGQFATMMECVPVIRPQDVPQVSGTGTISSITKATVTGDGTTFLSSLSIGDVIFWKVADSDRKCSGQVASIISDVELILTMPVAKEDDTIRTPTPYKYSKRIDHSEMYAEVYGTLGKGDAIGIFPEGGSHDRTSLQPLKAGVALFSLGARERGVDVTIIPVGLTYFYGHKFRSRAHVEFGKPIKAPRELDELFKTDKRAATGSLLTVLDNELREVTINVEDWATLNLLHTFRRLYQPPQVILDTGVYLKLTRRLANILAEHKTEKDVEEFSTMANDYSDFCDALQLRDAQVATLAKLTDSKFGAAPLIRLLFRRVVMLFLLGIVLLPFAFFGAPIGLVGRLLSEDHARTAQAGSSGLKIKAADVKASYKIIVGFCTLPLVCALFGAGVYANADLRTAVTMMVCLPMTLYVSLHVVREFLLEGRATIPLMRSLLSKPKVFLRHYERRMAVVQLAETLVAKYDPDLETDIDFSSNDASEGLRHASLFSLRHRSRK